MMRPDEALERLRSANPLPDAEHVDPDELGLFLADFEERRSSMMTTKDVHGEAGPPSPSPRWKWRPALAFALGLIVLLALVGGAAMLFGRGDNGDVATTPPPTTATPTTTAAPSTSAAPTTTSALPTTSAAPAPLTLDLEWTRVDLPADLPHPGVGTYGAAGWVAFSQDLFERGVQPVVRSWYSADGLEWEQNEEVIEGLCAPTVAAGPGFYLAVADNCQWGLGAILKSSDGIAWSEIPPDPVFADYAVGSIAYGDPGFVNVASDMNEERDWVNAFHSFDGENWTRVSSETAGVFSSDRWISERGLVYGHAGFVAIGAEDHDEGQIGVVWHSPDGQTWTRIPNRNDMFGGPNGPSTWIEMETLAYGNGVYAIVGIGGVTPSIWVSPDGTSWSLLPNEGGVFGSDAETLGIFDIAGGDRGFLAIGDVLELQPIYEGAEERTWSPAGAAVWSSPDGSAWTRIPEADASLGGVGRVQLDEVTYGDGRFVISGSELRSDPDDPEMEIGRRIVWVAE